VTPRISLLTRVRSRIRRLFDPNLDVFLKHSRGVIHIGANQGQERELYDKSKVRVLWIEPIPEVFKKLKENILSFPRQYAIQALISSSDGESVVFNIADNDGASSSMLEMADHKKIWPDVHFCDKIMLKTISLPSLLKRENISNVEYDSLVLDTQGAELMVLEGAKSMLNSFSYIKLEAPDFEAYRGCSKIPELVAFLAANGFAEQSRKRMAGKNGCGNYYDLLFVRRQ
jgi:FkbM family methyltransferase